MNHQKISWKVCLSVLVIAIFGYLLFMQVQIPLMVAFSLWLSSSPPSGSPPITPAEKQAVDFARQYLATHATEYSLKVDLSDLQVSRVDALFPDSPIVRFQQTYCGIPVEGAGIALFVRGRPDGNRFIEVSSSYKPHIAIRNVTLPYPSDTPFKITPRVSSFDSIVRAYAAVNTEGKFVPSTELLISPDNRSIPDKSVKEIPHVLVWRVNFHTSDGFRWGVIVDAMSGEILHKSSFDIKPPPTKMPYP